MTAFETKDVSKANFFSLMFFVVALGNLVVYAAAGWVSNEVGQVRIVHLKKKKNRERKKTDLNSSTSWQFTVESSLTTPFDKT